MLSGSRLSSQILRLATRLAVHIACSLQPYSTLWGVKGLVSSLLTEMPPNSALLACLLLPLLSVLSALCMAQQGIKTLFNKIPGLASIRILADFLFLDSILSTF